MASTPKDLEDETREPTGTTNGSEKGAREGDRGVLNRPGGKDDEKESKGE